MFYKEGVRGPKGLKFPRARKVIGPLVRYYRDMGVCHCFSQTEHTEAHEQIQIESHELVGHLTTLNVPSAHPL